MNLQGLAVASLHQSYVNHYVCFTTLLQKMSLKLISVLQYAESDVSCSAFVLWRLFKPTGRRFFACVLLFFALQEITESFTSFNYHFKLIVCRAQQHSRYSVGGCGHSGGHFCPVTGRRYEWWDDNPTVTFLLSEQAQTHIWETAD